jgi:hypothetical protein
VCYHGFTANQWALNSAVECHLHTVEVIGSNPIAPTITYELSTSFDSRSDSRSDGLEGRTSFFRTAP